MRLFYKLCFEVIKPSEGEDPGAHIITNRKAPSALCCGAAGRQSE